jgi:hypothetical protein
MAAIITRTGKGAAITQSENDSNLDSLCGINEPQTGITYTVEAADQNSTIEFSNASPVTTTLTLISTIIAANDTSDFQVTLKNIGAGIVTVTPTTNTFDDGTVTKTLAQYEWMTIQTDSTQTLWNIIASSDASKVDGLDASQLLRSDANDTATGNLIFNGANTYNGINVYTASNDFVGGISIDSVAITSTATELNILDGVTADTTEINLLENATSTDITSSDLLAGVINAVYPIGSIYISTVATNPGSLLGVGTWVASGIGSVLIGVGTSDEAYNLADTGGASTESSHLHSVSITSSIPSGTLPTQDGAPTIPFPAPNSVHTHDVVGNTGSNSPTTGDNLPPYLVVQIWERTA